MASCTRVLFKFVLLVTLLESYCKILDTEWSFKSRHKRYLVYKDGINWVQLIVGIGLPVEIENHSVTIGSVIKAYYLLPTNASDYLHPSYNILRRKRSNEKAVPKWNIYGVLEEYIERMGYGNGKSCLLRQICELSSTPLEHRWGILSEILQVILTPSLTPGESHSHAESEYRTAENLGSQGYNCSLLFAQCDDSFIELFSRVYYDDTNI